MNNELKIQLSSNLDYEGMVIYICSGNKEIALLNYEKGEENIEIELLSNATDKDTLVFPLDKFLEVLERSKKILKNCAEEDKNRKNY